jgi:glycosyltransferase involved in cell wall biosynthesis
MEAKWFSERLFTFVITSHNNCSTIIQTIEKLKIFEDFAEIIVVDDGSNDDSVSELQKLKLPNLFIHTQSNFGSAHARNIGLSKVETKWVSFIDGDDEVIFNDLIFLKNLLSCEVECDAYRFNFMMQSNEKISNICENSFNNNYLNLFHELGFWRYIYRVDFLRENSIDFFPTFRDAKGIFLFDDYFFLLNFLACQPILFDVSKTWYLYRDRYETFERRLSYENQLARQGVGILILLDKIAMSNKLDRFFIADILINRIERSFNLLRGKLPLAIGFSWIRLVGRLQSISNGRYFSGLARGTFWLLKSLKT